MSDLQAELDGIRGRLKAGGYTTIRLGGDPNAKVWPAENWKVCDSQADVPRLLAAVEAVLDTVESHPVPSKRDDPTGEITAAVERFGDAIEDAIRDHLGANHEA